MSRSTTIRILAGAGVLGAAAAVAVLLCFRFGPPWHYAEVDPGVLYRSHQPSARDLVWMSRHAGIRTIVDLCAEKRDTWQAIEERQYAREHGIRYVNIPVPGGMRGGEDHIRRFLEVVDDPASRPVLVHCWKGIKRTGVMVAIYRMEHGKVDNREAVAGLNAFGRTVEDFEPSAIECVERYVPRWRRAGEAQLPEPAAAPSSAPAPTGAK